ncbi:MAG: hypothetical protein WBO55_18350 [Rhizobiaceae bacterium]
MTGSRTIAAALLALALTLGVQSAAHAFITPFIMMDRWIKSENSKALATPGHAEWCAQNKPGYRRQWNNWRKSDGTVTYCSSPFYSLQFKPYQGN